MSLSERRRQLLDTDRWRPLGELVERWYAEPLADQDGHAPLEIEQVARQLGRSLPAALTEWYELVGQRLRAVQDTPRPLRELSIEDGFMRVWTENQGVWSIVVPVDAGDDPVCKIRGDFNASPSASLSRMLLGMLVSDTIVGAWSGSHIGALGELRAAVRGGYCDRFTDVHVERLHSSYKALDYAQNPFFQERYRGDDATLIRFQNNVAIEWMTATAEAFASLDALLELAPPGGENEVVVAFDALTTTELSYPVLDIDEIERLLSGAGHVGIAVGGSSPRFHIRTKKPERVRASILPAVPGDLLPKLTIATRPMAISAFEVLYPEGATRYVLPSKRR